MNQISQTVDTWITEDEIPVSPALKIIRRNHPWYGMSEEELEDRKEFIRSLLLKDYELLLQIPIQPRETVFWTPSHQDFLESAFNTWDYQRTQRGHSTNTPTTSERSWRKCPEAAVLDRPL